MPIPPGAHQALTAPDYEDVRDYLRANSGLPGPRSNLELLALAGELLDSGHAARLRTEVEEYLRSCGVLRLARTLLETDQPEPVIAELTRFAAADSWRVRESAAMAGQRVGDAAPVLLRRLVSGWVADPDPLVVRAAVATICEPRLLRTAEAAGFALATCRAATDALLAVPAEHRREPAVRTLRQALGYCWSVAVAADPAGLPEFLALGGDPDLEWIVRENRGKARLKKLLPDR